MRQKAFSHIYMILYTNGRSLMQFSCQHPVSTAFHKKATISTHDMVAFLNQSKHGQLPSFFFKGPCHKTCLIIHLPSTLASKI